MLWSKTHKVEEHLRAGKSESDSDCITSRKQARVMCSFVQAAQSVMSYSFRAEHYARSQVVAIGRCIGYGRRRSRSSAQELSRRPTEGRRPSPANARRTPRRLRLSRTCVKGRPARRTRGTRRDGRPPWVRTSFVLLTVQTLNSHRSWPTSGLRPSRSAEW